MTAIIQYHRVVTGENLADVYKLYTCPNDGYVYAWADSNDQSIIWHLSACPIDAVKATLVTEITPIVQLTSAGYASIADPHIRITTIINKVKEEGKAWLQSNTYDEVVNFLSNDSVLFPLIFAELVKQGVIT